MAATTSSSASFIGVSSLDHPLEIDEDLTLRVRGSAGERKTSARAIKLAGRRLIVQVFEHIEPGTCIRIDCDDAFLLGETLGCWNEQGETFAAMELKQALTRLTELARIREDYFAPPQPVKLRLLQSA